MTKLDDGNNIKSRAKFPLRRAAGALSGFLTFVGILSLIHDGFARAESTITLTATTHTTYSKARNPFAIDDVAYAPSTPPPAVAMTSPFNNPLASEATPPPPAAAGAPMTTKVIGISVGPQSIALVTSEGGDGFDTIKVGSHVEGRTVIDIELSGVTFSDGTFIAADPMTGSYAFPSRASNGPAVQMAPVGSQPAVPSLLPDYSAIPSQIQSALQNGGANTPTQMTPYGNANSTPSPAYKQ